MKVDTEADIGNITFCIYYKKYIYIVLFKNKALLT